MKKINILVLLILAIVSQLSLAQAQAPQAIPYQAAARNAQGQVLANQNIRVRFTLTDSIAGGVVLYTETHQTTTNALGLFNLNFGTGTIVSGSFTTFDWSKNNKFFKVELDTSATGNSYVDLGTQQLLSVPYALHSKTAESLGGSRNQGSDVKTLIYLMDGF
jgi:opacity protein-like surface antigen